MWDAAVFRRISFKAGDGEPLADVDARILVECANRMYDRAVRDNLVDNIVFAKHNLELATSLTSNDSKAREKALDEILAQKSSEGVLPSKKEQERIRKAQHDASPLKPLEDLIDWIKEQWEKWIYPTLKAVREMFEALWPLIKGTLDELPQSLKIIQKDLIVPYLKACENWKDYVDKLSYDLRHGEKAAAKDMNGMPAIIPPNLNVEEATHLKAALNLPLVRPMALGCLAPMQMLELQSNIHRGFYGPVQYYSWLLRNDVGPDIGGMVSDLLGVGRRVGRAVGGAGDALSGAGDVLGDIPDWFFSNTVPKIDIATGKTDYYLY